MIVLQEMYGGYRHGANMQIIHFYTTLKLLIHKIIFLHV